jgi:hypothetical protein
VVYKSDRFARFRGQALDFSARVMDDAMRAQAGAF